MHPTVVKRFVALLKSGTVLDGLYSVDLKLQYHSKYSNALTIQSLAVKCFRVFKMLIMPQITIIIIVFRDSASNL